VFDACATQWRIVATMAGARPQGLDYVGVETVMRLQGIADPAETFGQIQLIERGALEALAEQR